MKLKEFKKILSLPTLQKIQDNYSTALGIPISIRNSEGELLTKISNPSKLWSLIHSSQDAETKLTEPLKVAIDKCLRTGQVIIFERLPDTQTFLAPIYTGGKIVAFFVGGLVRFGNPNLDIAISQASQFNLDIDTYLDAYLSLHFFTKDRLEASANLIRMIGTTITTLETEGNDIKIKHQLVQEKNQQLKKTLETTSNRYKRLFNTVNDGIYVADFDLGTFVEINPAGAKMLGFKETKDLIGKKVKDLYVYPKDRDKYLQILKNHGKISNWVSHIITPQGEEKYFDTNATLIYDESSGKQLVQGIFRDLNQRSHRSI